MKFLIILKYILNNVLGIIYYHGSIITYRVDKPEDDIKITLKIIYHLQYFKYKVIKMEFTDNNLNELVKASKITIDEMNDKYKLDK